jgi:hypothetical protein
MGAVMLEQRNVQPSSGYYRLCLVYALQGIPVYQYGIILLKAQKNFEDLFTFLSIDKSTVMYAAKYVINLH